MVGSLRQYYGDSSRESKDISWVDGDGRESKDISWVDGRELAQLTFLSWKSRRGPSQVSDDRIERMVKRV